MLYNSRVFANWPSGSSVVVSPRFVRPASPERAPSNHGRRKWLASLVSASKIGSFIAGPFITLLSASCWPRVFSGMTALGGRKEEVRGPYPTFDHYRFKPHSDMNGISRCRSLFSLMMASCVGLRITTQLAGAAANSVSTIISCSCVSQIPTEPPINGIVEDIPRIVLQLNQTSTLALMQAIHKAAPSGSRIFCSAGNGESNRGGLSQGQGCYTMLVIN